MNLSLSNKQEKYIASQIKKGWEAPVNEYGVQDIIRAKTD
tara:strand:+ start:4676 stop:4795 length:120 start_codon:yes stop_codon:yes gene_type:complete